MAKINVFGKDIEAYDIGVTHDNGKRIPKETITPGVDDLPKETVQLLATYTSEVTRGNQGVLVSNEFPVEQGVTKLSLLDKEGNSAAPQKIASQKNGTQYIDEIPSVEAYSDSAPNKDLVKKGKESKGRINGHKLLRDNVESVYTNYTLPMLKNNRFTPRPGFNAPNVQGKEPGTFSGGNEATYHVNVDQNPQMKGNYETYVDETKELVAGHMSLVGPMLSLRSSRELLAATVNGYGEDGPDGVTADAAALLPGITQAGAAKVSTNDLTAMDALNSLIRGGASPANLDPDKFLSKHAVISFSRDSYGNMNNVNEPFSGIAALGTMALATALVIVLKQAMRGVLLAFSAITNVRRPIRNKKDSKGRYILGHYVVVPGGGSRDLFLGRLPSSIFGLRETVYDYNDCVNAGLEVFFGSGIGDLSKVIANPGFYATFCRAIVRSSTEIVESIKGALKGNPIRIAQNIVGLIDIIKASKIVGALNVFAQIGDNALKIAYDKQNNYVVKTIVNGEEIADATTLSTIDALRDINSSGYKSRLKDGITLAWRAGSTLSSVIAPRSLSVAIGLYSKLSGADAKVNAASFRYYAKYANYDLNKVRDNPSSIIGYEEKRIPIEFANQIEAYLDAEYMPFYFHDLRTNEIISFPAFLKSLSDSYSVNSETGEFYGRMDPVKIYKNTIRTISMSFYIVSTNLSDFSTMWLKINKLLTMIYPQWSEGNLLRDESGVQFIQPFSQVMTSSPLIRIRLGDLIRSNYSRFALTRLFGAGGKFNVMETETKEFTNPTYSAINDVSKDLPIGAKYVLQAGSYTVASQETISSIAQSALSSVSSTVGAQSKSDKPTLINFQTTQLVVIKKKITKEQYVVDYDDANVSNTFPKIIVSRATLSWSPTIPQKSTAAATPNQQKTMSAAQDFFSAKNSIVKSFNDVGGKGIACMINSMNFDWLEYPWETDEYGSRAPKMCAVTLDLTPMHDIAPGIDNDGFNRAPVYNVGAAMNEVGGDSWDESGTGAKYFEAMKKDRAGITRKGE
jgi:hypothetical protein